MLFYAIGTLLAVGAYALDSIDDLAVVLTFWLKQTLTFVVLGAGYGLYYVISGSAGHRPKRRCDFWTYRFSPLRPRSGLACSCTAERLTRLQCSLSPAPTKL
ncbi:hypothetical protein QIH80_36565 [Bradyrhizobium elkanii]|nr:hypothetical protein QIH80_36565 [Bradyrhizobium elkanii]